MSVTGLTQFNVAVVCQEDVGSLWKKQTQQHKHPRSLLVCWALQLIDLC